MRPASFSQRARREIAAVRRWIAKDSPSAARRLQSAINEVAVLLGEHQHSGVERPEIVGPPFRFASVPSFPYLIVYDASRSPPLIVSVVHGARDLPDALRDL